MKSSGEAGVLNLGAPVHDRIETGIACDLRGVLIPQSELSPEGLGANLYRFFRNAWKIFRTAERVDEVRSLRKVLQRRVYRLAQNLGLSRVDEVHAEIR